MDAEGTPTLLRRRVDAADWKAVEADLDAQGFALIPELLPAATCRALVRLYAERERFRSFVDLGHKRFGDRGDYRYFANPLPPEIRALRAALYRRLAPIANRWREALGSPERYPGSLAAFARECRDAGQTRPTPLLLHYVEGGYNCLHQDRYGAVAFPLQVACLLSTPERDFRGGDFLLLEQRPRMQSRGEAIRLERGQAIVFPNAERPVRGSRGVARAQVRHGVSRVASGERYTLGIIFHDAA